MACFPTSAWQAVEKLARSALVPERSNVGLAPRLEFNALYQSCCDRGRPRGRGQGYLGRSVLVLEHSNVEYCSGWKITKILTNAEVAATEDGRTPGLSAYQPPQSRPNPSGIDRGRSRSGRKGLKYQGGDSASRGTH